MFFEERKAELAKTKNAWRDWFLIDIFILCAVAVVAFFELTASGKLTPVLLLELAVIIPLAYSAIFFHAQHNREREFLEEYSFKSVVARSLESYRASIKADLNPEKEEEHKKFLDFVISSVKDLHTPPRAIISKHPVKDEEDIKIGVVEQLANVFKKFIP